MLAPVKKARMSNLTTWGGVEDKLVLNKGKGTSVGIEYHTFPGQDDCLPTFSLFFKERFIYSF